MSGVEDALRRFGRRMLLTVGRGRVTAANDAGNVQSLQIRLGANEVRDKTPRLVEFGLASMPPIGTDVVLLFVGGDRSDGVVIATGDQATRFKNMSSGEAALYDALGKYVHLSKDGIVVEAKDQPVTVNNATTVTVNASSDVTVNAGGNAAVVAKGSVEINGDAGVSINTKGSANATIGGSLTATASGNITISAPSIALN
ncbi:phage baseplate assembly protein V [Telmatospirillum sp.]|uniref:phage baseplate assembly protein V n=1 Tax=Telmatospirillum sp. TaxID=2079197 RepID=UPI00283FB8B5|nr:phage baseplate assembly protein V [Telmatospirillum sp.]MDR3438945.1 phage baseplate assembly protein V [Telmatospirillum sp.]